eukprot:2294947-Pleurochrysis_carterae.AAC.11
MKDGPALLALELRIQAQRSGKISDCADSGRRAKAHNQHVDVSSSSSLSQAAKQVGARCMKGCLLQS